MARRLRVPLAACAALAKPANLYANIPTKSYPGGALRGQLRASR